jgi:Tfp pilus assembly protein PilX
VVIWYEAPADSKTTISIPTRCATTHTCRVRAAPSIDVFAGKRASCAQQRLVDRSLDYVSARTARIQPASAHIQPASAHIQPAGARPSSRTCVCAAARSSLCPAAACGLSSAGLSIAFMSADVRDVGCSR